MIAVVLPAAIAAFTSGQVRSSMYTDCAPPECSGAAGVAAIVATFKKRAIAADSKPRCIRFPYGMAIPAAAVSASPSGSLIQTLRFGRELGRQRRGTNCPIQAFQSFLTLRIW